MTLILALLIFLPNTIIGFAIVHFLWKDQDLPAIALKFFIGLPLGLAINAAIFFLAMMAGVSPLLYSRSEFVISIILAGVFLFNQFASSKIQIRISTFSKQDIVGMLIVFAGAVLAVSAFLYYSRLHPSGYEDAWLIWNHTARFIFRDNSPAVLFNSQFYNRFHPDYPIALSLNVAWGWFIMKSETSRIPVILALLSTYTPAMIAWAGLSKWKGSLAGALLGLILFVTPDLQLAISQYADPLLTLHFFSAAVMLYGYIKSNEPRLLILAGLLTGFSAWVKNEGMLFIGIVSMACLFMVWKKNISRKAIQSFAIGLIAPVIFILIYKLTVSWKNDLFSDQSSTFIQILDGSRWEIIGRHLMVNIFQYTNWPVNFLIILLAYAMLTGLDVDTPKYQLLSALIVSGQLAGYFVIYLITPHDLELHINTSMSRLVSHLFPMAMLWVFTALRVPNLDMANKNVDK